MSTGGPNLAQQGAILHEHPLQAPGGAWGNNGDGSNRNTTLSQISRFVQISGFLQITCSVQISCFVEASYGLTPSTAIRCMRMAALTADNFREPSSRASSGLWAPLP